MARFTRLIYSPRLFDVLFAIAGAGALVGLVFGSGRGYPAVEAAQQPLLHGASLVGVLLAGILAATQTTRLDQKCADDFTFQTLTKSAFIAMMGLILTVALWEVMFADGIGIVPGHLMVGVIVAAWSLAYFYTRLRGTGA